MYKVFILKQRTMCYIIYHDNKRNFGRIVGVVDQRKAIIKFLYVES